MIIPFSPFPLRLLERLSSPLTGLGSKLKKTFPYLQLDLEQAELEIESKKYLAMAVFLSVFYFIFGGIFFSLILSKFVKEYLLLGLTLSTVFAVLVFIQISLYPKIIVKKKIRDLERNLIFALRTMLVQIKSGVSLFDSMKVVSKGNYGMVSLQFARAIEEIETGTLQEKALEDIAAKNPSPYFRKAMWQIVNGMKAGADVSTVLAESVNSIVREQKIAIAQFGAKLRLLSLGYMLVGVIVPALGLTFLIVLGTFPQIKITELFFWALLGGTMLMELMYLGIIKSNRPNLLG